MDKRNDVLCLLALIAVVAISAGCSEKKQPTNEYKTFTSVTDRFSVDVPANYINFETREQNVSSNGTKTTVYRSASEDMIFMIYATPEKLNAAMAADALATSRDALAKQGEALTKGDTKLDGQPALYMRYKTIPGGVEINYDAAFAYIDGYQYQVIFGASKDVSKLNCPEAKRFFESFKHLKAGEETATETNPSNNP